jgi:hypothetical protein
MKKSNVTYLKTLSIIFLVLIISILSCKKETSGINDEEEITASQVSGEADAEAELAFNGVFDDAMGVNDDLALGGTGVFGRGNACPNVSIERVDPAQPFPVRATIDFGTGCTARDGIFRKGKIVIIYSGRLMAPGSTATTTFDGFYVDSIKVEGTHKITNEGTGTANTPTSRKFKVEVTNGKLTKPNGNYVEWNSIKIITQIEGLTTPNQSLDDIFKIEGSARGRVKRGNLLAIWESSITEPLIKRFNCRWIVFGKIKTVRGGTSNPWTAILDFGNRICDNKATITINGNTRQITLP